MNRQAASSRWGEYRSLLTAALDAGYAVVSLDDWVSSAAPPGGRCLILRHDVDQRPAAALKMAEIEGSLGIGSNWYLRWRTAHPRLVAELRERGMPVGLHYETLTRLARQAGRSDADAALIERARATLREEIETFSDRFGPIRSICAHGDSRMPGMRNLELVKGEDVTRYGVVYEGTEVLRGVRLGAWLTDRRAAGCWKDGVKPHDLLASGVSPIMAVIHPNHWSSRGALGFDRLCSRLLPDPLAGTGWRAPRVLVCRRSDLPPVT